MSRVADILTVSEIVRHCTDPQCDKCRARGRWNRRKAWRTHKNPVHRKHGRK
jgi:hypothetical protein